MDEENCETLKVVLIGESGVGKTCIINRYLNNSFEEEGMSTTGASYASKTMTFPVYNKAIKFEIWDTAGQEKFKALTKIFYKDSDVAILVYDITRKESFEELKNYWYNEIKDNSPNNCIVSIAANKYDLYNEEKVSEDEARKFAKEKGLMFRCTSALTAEGIDDLFKDVGSKFLDPNYNPDDNNNNKNNNNENNNNNNNNLNDFQIIDKKKDDNYNNKREKALKLDKKNEKKKKKSNYFC